MLGDVQICTAVFSAARDYGTDSGFYLIGQFQKVFTVMFEFVNRLMHVSQSGVPLLFLEAFVNQRCPPFGKFLEGAHVQIPIVKKGLQFGHVPGQKAPVLANAVATHGRPALGHKLGQKGHQLHLRHLFAHH